MSKRKPAAPVKLPPDFKETLADLLKVKPPEKPAPKRKRKKAKGRTAKR